MGESPAVGDAPASEAIATTGLFLNIASVIALAVSLASWGASDVLVAAIAGVTAVADARASAIRGSRPRRR